jgi:hypothetical protein
MMDWHIATDPQIIAQGAFWGLRPRRSVPQTFLPLFG